MGRNGTIDKFLVHKSFDTFLVQKINEIYKSPFACTRADLDAVRVTEEDANDKMKWKQKIHTGNAT